jgi:CRISPR-associated protein Cas1
MPDGAKNIALHEMLNTLYIVTQGAYLRVDHETLVVEVEREVKTRVPVLHIGGVVCFGNVTVTAPALQKCTEDGRFLVYLTENGRYRGRVIGPTTGNVLLRQAQYLAAADGSTALGIAQAVVAGKLQNSRQVLLRGAREAKEESAAAGLALGAETLAKLIQGLPNASSLDDLRGREGEGAATYFSLLGRLILQDPADFAFDGRSRRPPRDRVNAVLSFLYTLLTTDCVAACEGVGLDPQMGFLHAVRPGRPSLALDLVEELRAFLADRLALTLINRRQLTLDHFVERPGGAVLLSEEGRKVVIPAYQRRKAEEVQHPVINRSIPTGLVPHVQARLLARHLRGDLEWYVPFTFR